MHQEPPRVIRIDRHKNMRRLGDADNAEDGDEGEPDEHQRTEGAADGGGTEALHKEQRQQHSGGYRHGIGREVAAGVFESFDRAQYRDRRCDHAVAIQQRGADQAERDEIALAAAPADAGQRHQRQDTAFAAVIGPHHHHGIFQRDDDEQRPANQREAAERAFGAEMAAIGLGNGLVNVERAGADIAINHAERGENRNRLETPPVAAIQLLWRRQSYSKTLPRPKRPVCSHVVSPPTTPPSTSGSTGHRGA